jgi:hypothetical protein
VGGTFQEFIGAPLNKGGAELKQKEAPLAEGGAELSWIGAPLAVGGTIREFIDAPLDKGGAELKQKEAPLAEGGEDVKQNDAPLEPGGTNFAQKNRAPNRKATVLPFVLTKQPALLRFETFLPLFSNRTAPLTKPGLAPAHFIGTLAAHPHS